MVEEKIEELDLSKFKQQFDSMIKENNRLNIIKTNYIQYAVTLKSMGETLIRLAKEIDPIQTISGRKSKVSKKEYIQEFYNLLLSGTQITRKLIETTYSQLNEKEVNYILTAIKHLPRVERVKDGQCIRLFLR